MPVYALEKGLVIRTGDAQWEVTRLIDGRYVQLEHQSTGRFRRERISKLTREIGTGAAAIVRGDQPAAAPSTVDKVGIVFCAESLPEAHRKAYLRANGYVLAIRKRQISKGQRHKISTAILAIAHDLNDPAPPSTSTVMGWLRLYEKTGGNSGALVSGNLHRNRRKGRTAGIRQIIDAVLKRWYFVRHGCTLRTAHDQSIRALEQAADSGRIEYGDAQVSLSTIRRIVHEVSPFDRDRIRLGTARARARWRFVKPGHYATRPLERVEMDHTLLDLWVIDEEFGIPLGRPTITLLICAYSAYIIGFFISFEGESLARVIRTIKIAIEPKDEIVAGAGLDNPWHAMGLWETLCVDNALAYHSEQFRMLCMQLCMDLEFGAVRMPWFKPVVERYIGETCRQLPPNGRPQKPGRHPDPIDPSKTACVTFSELCHSILRWVVDVQPFEINDRKKARPIDLWLEGLENCPAPAFVDSYANLDILAGVSRSVTVDHGGVVNNWLAYAGDELEQLRREIGARFRTTMKFDPNDLGRVFIQNPRDSSWITAEARDSEYAAGLSMTQHKLIRAAAAQKLTAANAESVLRKARLKLRDQWEHAVFSGKRVKREHTRFVAAQKVSLTASRKGYLGEESVTTPDAVLTDSEETHISKVIPKFETFVLGDE